MFEWREGRGGGGGGGLSGGLLGGLVRDGYYAGAHRRAGFR